MQIMKFKMINLHYLWKNCFDQFTKIQIFSDLIFPINDSGHHFLYGGTLPPISSLNNSPTLRCPTIWLNSYTVYVETASDPTGWGLSPPREAPHPISLDTNSKSRLSPDLLVGYRSEVSMTLSLGLIDLLEQLTELKHFAYWFTSLL